VVGRRLLAHEVVGEFANYVDLTAEFSEPSAIRRNPGYMSVPILDGSAPDPAALDQAVSRLRPGRTFIHCAQGHGRTGLFALAMLLRSGRAGSADEGLRKLQAARPGVRLSKVQLRCIERFAVS
jgi:protein-tyrosine phosphatase